MCLEHIDFTNALNSVFQKGKHAFLFIFQRLFYWFLSILSSKIVVTLFLLIMSLFKINRSPITLLPVSLSMLSKVFVKRHLLYLKSLFYVTLLALMDGIWLPIQIYHLQVKRLEDPSQGISYSQTSTWLALCNFTGLQIHQELLLCLALFLEVTLGCISQLLLQISGMEQTSFLFQQASKVIKDIITLMVC